MGGELGYPVELTPGSEEESLESETSVEKSLLETRRAVGPGSDKDENGEGDHEVAHGGMEKTNGEGGEDLGEREEAEAFLFEGNETGEAGDDESNGGDFV